MRATILIVATLLSAALLAPGAVAEEQGAQASVCGSYNYQDDGGRDGLNATVKADAEEGDADVILELPSVDNVLGASSALASDVADGEAGEDEDGLPDPFDGTGFVHASVNALDGEEQFGAGSDALYGNHDPSCP